MLADCATARMHRNRSQHMHRLAGSSPPGRSQAGWPGTPRWPLHLYRSTALACGSVKEAPNPPQLPGPTWMELALTSWHASSRVSLGMSCIVLPACVAGQVGHVRPDGWRRSKQARDKERPPVCPWVCAHRLSCGSSVWRRSKQVHGRERPPARFGDAAHRLACGRARRGGAWLWTMQPPRVRCHGPCPAVPSGMWMQSR